MNSKIERELHNKHDDVLYTLEEYGSTNLGRIVNLYESIRYLTTEMDNEDLSDEAKKLIARMDFDLEGLEGFSERLRKLYFELTGVLIE